jgi:hypothetical protein
MLRRSRKSMAKGWEFSPMGGTGADRIPIATSARKQRLNQIGLKWVDIRYHMEHKVNNVAQMGEGVVAREGGDSGQTQVRRGPTGKVQRIKSRGAQWCEATEEEFFDVLAASCNVTLATETVGFTTPTVYRLRRMRPDFAARWQAALEQGYARLEMELLRAATDTLADQDFDESRPVPRMTVEQAANVLRAHRNEVRGGGDGGPGARARRRGFAEVRASITAKLVAVERSEGLRRPVLDSGPSQIPAVE